MARGSASFALAIFTLAAPASARADASVNGVRAGSGAARIDPPPLTAEEVCLTRPAGPPPGDDEIGALRRLVESDATAAAELPRLRLRLAEFYWLRDFRESAIQELAKLTSDDRAASFERIDEALFDLGRLELDAGHATDGRRYLFQLLKQYPKSSFLSDVYVLFGDWYRRQGEGVDAERFYQRALSFPDARCGAYLQYQLGAIAYQDARYPDALGWFHKTLARNSPAPGARLADAARRGLVAAYAKAGRPERAANFFATLKPERDALLRMLADAYAAEGRTADRDVIERALAQSR